MTHSKSLFTPTRKFTKRMLLCLLVTFGTLFPKYFLHAQQPVVVNQQLNTGPDGKIICATEVTEKNIQRLTQVRPQLQAFTRRFSSRRKSTQETVLIPIQIHISRRADGTGGADPAAVREDMINTNILYQNVGLQFVEIADINFIDSDQYFDFDASDENLLLSEHYVDGALNIYFFNGLFFGSSALCGYTYLPGSVSRDFIMMNKDCSPGATLPHEIGHYFGLYHTHGKTNCGTTDELVDGSNCEIAGDDVCDTPADPNLLGINCTSSQVTANCTYTGTALDANGMPFDPDTRNIMSYSRDACQDRFSNGQYARMRFVYEEFRSYLGFTQDTAACQVPALLFVSSREPDSSRINWNTTNAEAYNLEYRAEVDSVWTTLELADSVTSVVLSGLESCTVYEYRLQPLCDSLTGTFSNIRTFRTTNCPCVIPDNLGVENLRERSATLTYSGNPEIDISYNIQLRPTGQAEWFNFTTTDTFLNLIYFEPCTEYEFRVKPFCSDTTYSAPFVFTTEGCNGYCQAFGRTDFEFIDRITIDSIDNLSGNNFGYADFFEQTTNMVAGDTYGFSFEPGFEQGQFLQYWRVYIDTNRDSIFSLNEEVYSSNFGSVDPLTDSFTVPGVVDTGLTRMRVIMTAFQSFGACGSYSEGEVEDYGVYLQPPILGISPDFRALTSQKDSFEVLVAASEPWMALSEEEWVSISVDSAKGDTALLVIVEENLLAEARSAEILFTSQTGVQKTLLIEQDRLRPILNLNPRNLNVGSQAGFDTIQVNSNVQWEAFSFSDWVTISPERDSGDGIFIVSYPDYNGRFSRRAIISVVAQGISRIVSVDQAGVGPQLLVEPDTLIYEPEGGSQFAAVFSNLFWEVLIPTDVDWLFADITGDSNNGLVEFSTEPYDGLNDRQTAVTVVGSGIVRTLLIIQKARIRNLEATPASLTFDENGGQQLLSISSNISWTINSSAEWLTTDTNQGTDNDSILVMATPNLSNEIRTGMLTILGEGQLIKVMVVQEETLQTLPFPEPNPSGLAGRFLGQATINGTFAEAEDYIAAFDEAGNIAGRSSIIQQGETAYISLLIFGDDPNTAVDEGIGVGEAFTLSLFDASTGEVYQYPNEENPIEFSDWENANGSLIPAYSDINAVYDFGQVISTDTIPLRAGWNLIAIDVMPEDESIATVFAGLKSDNLDFITGYENNAATFYDPDGQENLNTLTKLTQGAGYWVRVFEPDTLTVSGKRVLENYRLPLKSGWNLMGYMPERPGIPSAYFSDLIARGNLLTVTGFNGEYLYFDPDGLPFLNSLNLLENSTGYWVELSELYARKKKSGALNSNKFMFVGGRLNGKLSNIPGELEIVDRDGNLIRKQRVLENGLLQPVPIYSGDFKSGKKLFFKLNGEILDESLSFSPDMLIHELSLNVGEADAQLSAFPNPFTNRLTINFQLSNKAAVQLQIFNINGQLMTLMDIGILSKGAHNVHWQPDNLDAGTYVVHLIIDGVKVTEQKILHMK